MFMNWTELLGTLKRSYTRLGKTHPRMLEAYRSVAAAQGANGALDAKTRELIAIAIAVTTRCDGCISSHAAAAAKAGATEAEMADAMGVAIALNAGAAYVYSLRAMEAFSELGAKNA
ncbi:MAG: carboxymuconolactone decarboxylase family protein [Burkholderiales bacterium]|nr:carboxymuconolactone decarboxylase family protein [Burkholderiales bacterium]MDE1925566.1 carboxymuconolactone decarboxylase family protein [Burkholderiales bacterium]MDE2157930.1 carboxymuconolactone decarboxylase family protein [Burkholderiales bacterium]MDE2503273.1 carboxymuconolactone decarboxylase family protein [Burkholderiales bacterium]